MSTLDRRLRSFAAAPLLVIAALLVGAGTAADHSRRWLDRQTDQVHAETGPGLLEVVR